MDILEKTADGSLHGLSRAVIATFSVESIKYLEDFVRKGEFRDEEISSEACSSVFALLVKTVDQTSPSSCSFDEIRRIRESCLIVIASDEFDAEIAKPCIPPNFTRHIVERSLPSRINAENAAFECRFIQESLLLIYRMFPYLRPAIRKEVGKFLRDYAVIPTRSSHLTPILNVLSSILSGISNPDPNVFREILLPLHRPNGWSFWDRQTPILAEYHKSLVQCCYVYIQHNEAFATELADYLLSHAFPPIHQANTPKELLLLFEINKFINFIDLKKIKNKFFAKLLECLDSENAQIVQSCLTFWKSPPSNFPSTIVPFLPEFMEPLVMILFRGSGEPHWNPTVNKMTLLVLKSLMTADESLFQIAASKIPPTRFPPSTVSRSGQVPQKLVAEVHVPNQPPLGITGIAPWIKEPIVASVSPSPPSDGTLEGIDALEEYMHRLSPSTDLVDENSKSWNLALSSETPTLLPDLKFHNLVFGRDLGSGSFSTVRYARVVKPGGKTFLSQWDEVAVKIINFETINKNNYGENILREICCLRQLAHPSIARLISSFRWRDGIYLVLEYGSLGDLHSYIRSQGALGFDSNCAKIVLGEIATALVTVHESGFVYGDLKPENVVITATRHIKLADFGACRPVTKDAKNLVLQSRDALTNMRSGDWKVESATTSSPSLPQLSEENILNPKTFEGTTVYLSPEVVARIGSGPTVLSDAWAFGMTMYFVLVGRLPGWASAACDSSDSSVAISLPQLIKSDSNIGSFDPVLQGLFFALFDLDTDKRMSLEDAIVYEWFDDVQEVRTLYKRTLGDDHLPGVCDVSSTSTKEDSQWEKRQLSKIWTAQPVDYALVDRSGENGIGNGVIQETDFEKNSPFL